MFCNLRNLLIIFIVFSSTQAVEAGPYNKPIYNPDTKSYFELYNPQVKRPGAAKAVYDWRNNKDWPHAQTAAASKFFKGVRGRLAVVKTLKTHEFLRKHFVVGEPTWIGLRYWCSLNKLQWVTGEIHPLTAFNAWARKWNVEGADPKGRKDAQGCEKGRKGTRHRSLGVHYWATKDGFLWNANGFDKAFTSLFIEYPTGKP